MNANYRRPNSFITCHTPEIWTRNMLPAVKTENVFTAASIFLIHYLGCNAHPINECKLPKTEFIYHMPYTRDMDQKYAASSKNGKRFYCCQHFSDFYLGCNAHPINECKLPKTEFIYRMHLHDPRYGIRNMLPAVKTENVFTAGCIFLIFIWL